MGLWIQASQLVFLSSNPRVSMSATVKNIDQCRTPQDAFRGVSVLGHAIEHLSDQYVLLPDAEQNAVLKAIDLLMKLRESLYAETETSAERERQPLWSRLLAG